MPQEVFATLPAPLVERILHVVFVAEKRRMAARARLCCVCKCAHRARRALIYSCASGRPVTGPKPRAAVANLRAVGFCNQ